MSIQPISIQRISKQGIATLNDHLAIEEPLEIRLAWVKEGVHQTRSISITMRTPGQDEELALGFLFTEGILSGQAQLKAVEAQLLEQAVLVELEAGEIPDIDRLERNFYMTSSCGVCGKTSIDAVFSHKLPKMPEAMPIVKSALIQQLPAQLRSAQQVFDQTGGLHAAALFHPHGELIFLREDIGRHNAVDKVIGAALQRDLIPLGDYILLLSGRAGFELVQKSVLAGIPIVAAVGAPSSLAAQLAKEAGITLLGFVKESGFNIYCGAERIRVIP